MAKTKSYIVNYDLPYMYKYVIYMHVISMYASGRHAQSDAYQLMHMIHICIHICACIHVIYIYVYIVYIYIYVYTYIYIVYMIYIYMYSSI